MSFPYKVATNYGDLLHETITLLRNICVRVCARDDNYLEVRVVVNVDLSSWKWLRKGSQYPLIKLLYKLSDIETSLNAYD